MSTSQASYFLGKKMLLRAIFTRIQSINIEAAVI